MSVAAFLVVLIALGAANPLPAGADWQTWERSMDSARRALEQGREATAEYWFRSAVREAEKMDVRDPRLAQSLQQLLALYRKLGRHRDAEDTEKRLATLAPAAARASADPTGPEVVAALDAYAAFLSALDRERDAGFVKSRSDQLRRARSGGGRAELLYFNPVAELREYAALLRQRNRDTEAHAMETLASALAHGFVQRYANLRRGLARETALPSFTHIQLLHAGAEAIAGRLYPEAEAFLTDAVKIAETFVTGDVALANTLSRLAYAYAAQRKDVQFDQAAQRALPSLEQAGAGHGLVLPSLKLLALAHLRFGFDPGKTKAHLVRAMRVLERGVSPDHPVIGLHFAGLAAAHLALEGPDRAKPDLERALAIAQQQYLPDHVHLAVGLMKVVDIAMERGDQALAHDVTGRVVTILTRMLDPRHPDVIFVTEYQRVIRRRMERPVATVALAAPTGVPIEMAGNTMLVHVTLNRAQRARLIVDTGASTTLIRPLLLTRLGVTIPDTAPREKIFVVGGTTVEVAFVTLASVQLGDATIENLPVAIGDAMPDRPDIDGLLGADVLQRFRMTVDRQARRMTLEPASR